MKKAVIHYMFLGFLSLSAIATFVATTSDERVARNKYFELEQLANNSIKTMGIVYKKAIDAGAGSVDDAMCTAQTTATSILNASSLGTEIVSEGLITYGWKDDGTYDSSTGAFINSTPDNFPDSVYAIIAPYEQHNFWYKLLGKDKFEIPPFTRAGDLTNFNFDTTVYFRDVINAGYYNMVGTYELDANGCATNPQLILDNKNDYSKGDILTEIQWPDRRLFFISDGYRRFGNFNTSTKTNPTISVNSQIELEHDCVNFPNSTPVVKITTSTNQVQRSSDTSGFYQPYSNISWAGYHTFSQRAYTYFEDSSFNHDNGYQHMDQIAESDYGKFIAFIEPYDNFKNIPEAKAYYDSQSSTIQTELDNSHIYDEWITFASTNNIDYATDPDDDYVFVSEDLSTINGEDPWNSDKDFTDMSINLKKVFIPTPIDPNLISTSGLYHPTCP